MGIGKMARDPTGRCLCAQLVKPSQQPDLVTAPNVVQRWMVMGMTEREKLVQLLMNIPQVNHAEAQIHGMQYVFECAADYLIANGVRLETNQATSEENKRWIPVTERLPEQGQEVIVYNGGVLKPKVYCYLFWDKNFDNWARVTYWMPLPEPPKEAE